jgi:sulfur carrier protein
MYLTVNGERREVTGRVCLAELVVRFSGRTRGVAVAVNGTVAPRSTWEGRTLCDGDRIEILTAVQGG